MKLFFVFFLTTSFVTASEFHATGELEYVIYSPKGEAQKPSLFTFSVSIKDCRWIFRTVPLDKSRFSGAEYYETATDGENTYTVTVFSPGDNKTNALEGPDEVDGAIESIRRKRERNRAGLKAFNVGTARIIPGAVPVFDETCASVLWLAYGSGCFFESIGDSKIPLVVGGENPSSLALTNRLVRAEWQLQKENPPLPSLVAFFNDGKFFSGEKPDLEVDLPKPYDNGYVVSRYETKGTLSEGGISLPASFSLTRLLPKQDGKSVNDLRTMYSFHGRTLSVSKPAGVGLPTVPGTLAAADHRLRSERHSLLPLVYRVEKETGWLSTKQVKETKAFKEAVNGVSP